MHDAPDASPAPTPETATSPSPPPSDQLLPLAGQHAREVLADTEAIVRHAEARLRAIPPAPAVARELRSLGAVLGEVVIRLAVVEHAVNELLGSAGRPALPTRVRRPDRVTDAPCWKPQRPAWLDADAGGDWPKPEEGGVDG